MLIYLVVLLLQPSYSFAFFDYMAEKSDEVAKGAAYTDAVSDLIDEIDPDSSIANGARDLDTKMKNLKKEAGEVTELGREIDYILKGPNWNSKHLLRNIRRTTSFVRRLKRMIIRVGILGMDGTTAVNTLETNVSLNDIMKNQQTLILMEREKQFLELQRRQHERRSWKRFLASEKKIREGE